MSLLDLETRVFSRINNKVKSKLKSEYPRLSCTNSDRNIETKDKDSNDDYPLIYVHELSSPEIGSTLDGETINGLLSSFEITVFADSNQDDAKVVMNEVVLVMKSMRYQMIGSPFNDNDNGLYRRIARFRRVIGASDTL